MFLANIKILFLALSHTYSTQKFNIMMQKLLIFIMIRFTDSILLHYPNYCIALATTLRKTDNMVTGNLLIYHTW